MKIQQHQAVDLIATVEGHIIIEILINNDARTKYN